MIIRMFEYGFKKAKEISRNSEEETVIYIPKQLVIFIEENKNIKNELKMKLIFPDKQEVNYIVPVLKCWEYDDKRIIEEKMYPLLPLQIFKLRYKMESIKRSIDNDKSKLTKAILEAKEMAEIVAKEGKELYDKGEIDGEDLHRILLAIGNLFEYLNKKYGDNEKLNEEVASMTKTLYDPVVEEKGIETGENKRALKDAVNFLKLGVNEEIVAQGTGLSIDIIRELKKEIMN